MPEFEVLLAEQFVQTQDILKVHYKQILAHVAQQRTVIGELRKENDELRTQLSPTARAWEASNQEDAATPPKQQDVRNPPRHAPQLDLSVVTGPTVELDLGVVTGSTMEASDDLVSHDQINLPGEVDSGLRARNAHRQSRASHVGGHQRSSSVRVKDQEAMSVIPRPEDEAETQAAVDRVSRLFKQSTRQVSLLEDAPAAPKAIFADAASMKERVRQAILKPEYHVSNYYKDTGLAQLIARHTIFENFTLVVIFLNAIWIAVDSDLNDAPVIFKADFVFQIVDYSFFAYFMFEWVVRFSAFRNKRDSLRDSWFVFDSSLVLLMVVDGWVVSVIILLTGSASAGGSTGALPVIRILRLLRLSRMMRVARLLRAAPEVMILIKGIAGAVRSVGFTLLLLSGIIYVFSIAFRTLADGTALGETYFSSVPKAATTLLFDGTLPDLAPLVHDVAGEHFLFGLLLVAFILLASLTVMNMLVGVLVEVVCTVSSVEKEQMEATFLKGHMLQLLKGLDEDGDVLISKDEFGKLLEKPKAIKALQEVGVDVVGLAELSDFIYKDRLVLTFPDFMEAVLQLRGTNTATVKSIVDMRMFMTQELSRVEDNLLDKLHQVIQMDITTAMGLTPSAAAPALLNRGATGLTGDG